MHLKILAATRMFRLRLTQLKVTKSFGEAYSKAA